MNYKITITRKEANPNYAVEMAKWEEENKYRNMRNFDNNGNFGGPSPEMMTNALICELTEEQYKKVKAEVFKTFE